MLGRLGASNGADFRPWVFRIAANEMASIIRSGHRRAHREHVVAGRERSHADPFASVDVAIDSAPVLEALSRLSERHHAVLALRYLSDLDPAEVATALGISAGNVSVTTHRALRALRRALTSAEREGS